MTKKKKRLLVLAVLLLISAVIVALGLKYFPFTRLVRMPAAPEQSFVNPAKAKPLPPNTLYFDFEIAPGKEVPGGFNKGLAHSGQYSVKAFGQNSFSVAVERTAGEIGLQNLKAVALSAWVYVFPTDKEVKGNFVFTASNGTGINVCWEAIWVLDPEVPRGKWFKISKYIDLSAIQFKPEYKVQVYFWNNSSTDILIDDYFISFGGPVDRRGDSARVDMTKPEGFVAKFNLPPFPTAYLDREPLEKPEAAEGFNPQDLAVAGDFLNAGNDALVTVKKDGRMTLQAFCPESRAFRAVTLVNAAALKAIAPVTGLAAGNFRPGRTAQVLISGAGGSLLCALEPQGKPCANPAAALAVVKVLAKTPARQRFVAGDFNGDGRSELLEIANDGSWTVSQLTEGQGWKAIPGGTGTRPDGWDGSRFEMGITAGEFSTQHAASLLLSIERNKSDGTISWSLLKFNPTASRWDALHPERNGRRGLVIGLDTLKPADRFFVVTGPGNRPVVLRYNRDWRFDLKEISFNDSTYAIRSWVDFRGYDNDCNPKFYETLALVPGRFGGPGSVGLLVSGRVDPARGYQALLPDLLQLYSFREQK